MDKQGRQRIEQAALELFASRGIDKASTRAIARRAGLAEGTLYRHFRTKEDLAATLFVSLSGRLAERLDAAVRQAPTPPERLRAIVRAFFAFAAESPQAFEFIAHRHPPLSTVPAGARLPKDILIETLRAGIDQGQFRPLDPLLATALITGMIFRTLFFTSQGALRHVEDEVADAALRVLKETPP